MKILSKKIWLIIFFNLFVFTSIVFCQISGYIKVDKLTLIKQKNAVNDLNNITENIFSTLKNKNFSKLYDLIPFEFKEGVSKEVFIKAFDSSTVDNLLSTPWIEVSDFYIQKIEYIDDKNADVKMSVSYKDMFSGVKDQVEIWPWNKQSGVWQCPKLYTSLMDKARWLATKQGQFNNQELKKEIVKQAIMDEVYTRTKRED